MQLNTLCPPDRAGCWLSRRGWPEPRPCLGSQAGLPPWSRSGQDCHDKHLCRFTLCMDWLKSRRKVNVCKSKAFFHLIKSANSALCFTWVKIQVHRSRPVLRSPSTNSTLLSWNCTFSHCFQEAVKYLSSPEQPPRPPAPEPPPPLSTCKATWSRGEGGVKDSDCG